VNGRKRHIAVDAAGLLLAVVITAASDLVSADKWAGWAGRQAMRAVIARKIMASWLAGGVRSRGLCGGAC
jgi:hypothetical protein